ncbi:MAG: hypothetical protein IPO94_06690 [Saprospiraceae bacterium]|nr:hypothetical protein [Saprospiraceae bacterium]
MKMYLLIVGLVNDDLIDKTLTADKSDEISKWNELICSNNSHFKNKRITSTVLPGLYIHRDMTRFLRQPKYHWANQHVEFLGIF